MTAQWAVVRSILGLSRKEHPRVTFQDSHEVMGQRKSHQITVKAMSPSTEDDDTGADVPLRLVGDS